MPAFEWALGAGVILLLAAAGVAGWQLWRRLDLLEQRMSNSVADIRDIRDRHWDLLERVSLLMGHLQVEVKHSAATKTLVVRKGK